MARTVGEIADAVLALQLKIKKKELEVEDLKKATNELKEELKLAAEAVNLTSGGGKKSEFTIEPEILPQASNWDSFYQYIHDNKYFHLLQRRPAVKACQELWSQGTAIPGIDKFTKTKVTVKGA